MISPTKDKQRLLVFIVAYNAERTIEGVLRRIPHDLAEAYHVEILIIDDSSKDGTFERGHALKQAEELPFTLHILYNPVNQGYGGNQKIGYHFAIERGFDFVALVHGDGQYAPECLPDLMAPLTEGAADAVFGSRMMTRGAALRGGMPLYKFVGNKILSWLENRMLRTDLTEFHSGYRVYSVAALRNIPFHLNSDVFHFDTEIIIQFVFAGLRIRELPIPTYYGDEICHVDGLKYAWDVVKAVLMSRAQELNLLYDPKYDCRTTEIENAHYEIKRDYCSPHTETLARVGPGARILDLGCAGGYMGVLLRQERNAVVTGVDMFPLAEGNKLDAFILHDLNAGPPPTPLADFDRVLLLDVIEHLAAPEEFVAQLRRAAAPSPNTSLIVSTGNVAFAVTRFLHLFGLFNYGKRGILDLTHTRLFTFATLHRLFAQAGFDVKEVVGIPVPFPLAFGDNWFSTALLWINRALIRIWKSMFSYQIFMVVQARPILETLLDAAHERSGVRAREIDENSSKTA
ncbi:MAG: glycosyltransferase [Rhodospirillaceae bacterium]|jgi:glycosyltransferase involved in cell wall biosynthesis|nr:glycosyltransferase [Rhodospirillaceae bacterium]